MNIENRARMSRVYFRKDSDERVLSSKKSNSFQVEREKKFTWGKNTVLLNTHSLSQAHSHP